MFNLNYMYLLAKLWIKNKQVSFLIINNHLTNN